MTKSHKDIRYCPECHADLRGKPIPQKYLKKGYYGKGVTHFSRLIGFEDVAVYDGVCCWMCPDCGFLWKRTGFGKMVSAKKLKLLRVMGRELAAERSDPQ